MQRAELGAAQMLQLQRLKVGGDCWLVANLCGFIVWLKVGWLLLNGLLGGCKFAWVFVGWCECYLGVMQVLELQRPKVRGWVHCWMVVVYGWWRICGCSLGVSMLSGDGRDLEAAAVVARGGQLLLGGCKLQAVWAR